MAEQIGTMIEAGLWTSAGFPPREEIAARFRSAVRTVTLAEEVLAYRGVLTMQLDASYAGRHLRLLPHAERENRLQGTAVERVEAMIVDRISSGVWAGKNFPGLERIIGEARCSRVTASRAAQNLADRGVLHKVSRRHPDGTRAPGSCWRPVAEHEDDAPDLLAAVRQEAAASDPAATLPPPAAMAAKHHVAATTMRAVYATLAAEGVIRKVFPPRSGRAVWQTVAAGQPRQGGWPQHPTRSATIAAEMREKLGALITHCEDGVWELRALPPKTTLRQRFGCHYDTLARALEQLREEGLLQQIAAPGSTYPTLFPTAPAEGSEPARLVWAGGDCSWP